MVTRDEELWQLVEESYGNSSERLIVSPYDPFQFPVSRAFARADNPSSRERHLDLYCCGSEHDG